jgi:hypothetical protein
MEGGAPHWPGGNATPPTAREEMGLASEHRNKCQDPSLCPNEMSELLTAPELSGMLLIAWE